jgi:hypothetical protein
VRRRRRTLTGLLGVALLAAIGANGSARAQTSGTSDLASQFGGYVVDGDSEGMSFTYNSPGLIPGTGSPLFQVSFPESLTNMNKSPSAYALASLVYPGPLLADLPTVLALGGFDQQTEPLGEDRPMTGDIPAYPVRAEAFYPSGPTSASQDVGSGRETVATAADSASATAFYGAATLPPLFTTGSATSRTETKLEEGRVISRTRVELTGVDLFASLIHIESIVTDLVATSNATEAATDGTTTVTGMTFLGLPATLDAEGIHLAPQTSDPGAPVSLPPLGGATNPLQPVLEGLDALMVSTLGAANTNINDLLKQGGITVQLIDPIETKNPPGEARRLASGVLVTINYTGDDDPTLGQLLGLIDPTQVPDDYVDPCTRFQQPTPCPIPFTSPQTLVLAMKATHVETIGLASGQVHAAAAAPFTLPRPTSVGGLSSPGTPSSGFTTPTPALGGGAGGSGGGASIASATPLAFVGGSPLAAAVSALLLLLTGSAFWFGSGRLADNVLSVASSSCPEGLDRG